MDTGEKKTGGSGYQSLVALGYFIVKAICFHDYNRGSVRDACPGLFEFMVVDFVSIYIIMIVVATVACCLQAQKKEWIWNSWQSKVTLAFVGAVVVGMYIGKVYVIQLSWFNETCKEASSTHFAGQTDMGGHRVLEILGWVDISWQSIVLLCGFCACVPAILSR